MSEDTVFFGRSKRFRAEDHLPVPWIQTFLCGVIQASFRGIAGVSEVCWWLRCSRFLFLVGFASFILRLLCCCSVLGSRSYGSRGFRADAVLVSLLNGECVLCDAVAIVLFTSLEKHIDEASPPFFLPWTSSGSLFSCSLAHSRLALFRVHGLLVYHHAEYLSLF